MTHAAPLPPQDETDALQIFIKMTGRLVLSPAEFHQWQHWSAGWRVPEAVEAGLMRRVLEELPEAKRRGLRLAYIRWPLDDAIMAWKRAVGPGYSQK